ncbi:MAG: phenylalanine--tRNA ligase beta subunit-related protein [Candidatus Bathyarchaeota archaeon]|nr:phenylalanine--tRNA ligase beta subunit-related protein [Candidatus Bathyarchaeota archaeon]
MYLNLDTGLKNKYPGLSARMVKIHDVTILLQNDLLEVFKPEVYAIAQKQWDLDRLKENPTFRAYRDFFWKVGIDPTKIRPASEALIRRILRGNSLPHINTFVDAYNLASIATAIPFGAFDLDKMNGILTMREALKDEKFLGIGMENSINLSGGEVVIQDEERLIAIYPYRDADYSKVSPSTRNVLLMVCGVPGILNETLLKAESVGINYVTKFNEGVVV